MGKAQVSSTAAAAAEIVKGASCSRLPFLITRAGEGKA